MFADAITTADAKGASRETFKGFDRSNSCAIVVQRPNR
jgi:hypothetical protein